MRSREYKVEINMHIQNSLKRHADCLGLIMIVIL